ncbi:MAG TPA: transposase [Solirubrobacteraceae bacterium]|nr:transposase [Solirubrobacteraceae bacterium]
MTNATRWVGIDRHRRRSQIAIIGEHGEITQQRIATGRQTFTDALGDPDETHVALEATYGWEWLADQLTSAGFDVHLAHPLRTRAIAAARVNTDAVDARTLAHCFAPTCCPRRGSHQASCVTCCVTATRSWGYEPRSRTGCMLARHQVRCQAGLAIPDGQRLGRVLVQRGVAVECWCDRELAAPARNDALRPSGCRPTANP